VYRELELKLTCYYWWQDAKKASLEPVTDFL
jgi:hypothetical protein